MQLPQRIENICYYYFKGLLLLFFVFLAICDNLYVICSDLDLFYDTCNRLTLSKKIHYFLMIFLSLFDIFVKEN